MIDPARSTIPGRTSLDDFAPAFAWIRTDLVVHEGRHGQAWRKRSVAYHARHAVVHLLSAFGWMLVTRPSKVDLHLTHAGCRVLMGLALWADARPFRACKAAPRVTPLRAVTPSTSSTFMVTKCPKGCGEYLGIGYVHVCPPRAVTPSGPAGGGL